jgi:RNA polymerase sigma-70 factor, ECF subfamily
VNGESDTLRAEQFMEQYVPCHRRLYVYIVMLVGNSMVAQDILQDTNLILWQKFNQFQPGTNFYAWAREVARYRVLEYNRLVRAQSEVLDPAVIDDIEFADSAPNLNGDFAEALDGCLKKLPDADARLVLSRYSGLSVKVLAVQLNRSQNAVSQALARIRRALRTCVTRTLASRSSEGCS